MSQGDRFCTYLVGKGDFFYRVGRKIALDAYCKAWRTVNLIDENDFGVVVFVNDRPAGNLNLQLKKGSNLLKSEKFFHPNHWSFLRKSPEGIAELSALAIDTKVSFKLRPSLLKALILGVQSLCCAYQIKLLATVQHQTTVKIFSDGLGLELVKNLDAKINSANIPNDNYWNATIPPALYYLEPSALKTQALCASFFSELQLAQAKTTFVNQLDLTQEPIVVKTLAKVNQK